MTRQLSRALLMGLIGLLLATEARAAGPADEAAIKGLIDQFAAAWKKNDAPAMAGVYTADADLTNPFGRTANGKAEIEKLFAEEHAGGLKGTEWMPSKVSVRFLSADVAVATMEANLKGMKGPDGSDVPFPAHQVTNVFAKKGGVWRVEVTRVAIPAPAPPKP